MPTSEYLDEVIQNMKESERIYQKAGHRNTYRIIYFARAMVMITEAEARIPCDSAISADQVSSYRNHAAGLIRGNVTTFKNFLFELFDRSSRAINDGWRTPCSYRSAVQFLQDNFEGVAQVLTEEDIEFLEEIDKILRESASSIEPLPVKIIPSGIPASHWWWRIPSATPEEAADARSGG